MLPVSIILFAIAALGGATLAVMRITNRPLPLALALVHGAVAATALVLLIIAVATASAPATLATVALVLFILAALGGFVLFSFHLRTQPLPVPLVLGHGLLAVAAFLLLLFHAVG
jgi:hypothetical protein